MSELIVLQFLAWLAMGAVMFLFAATGGFDLGAGILLPFLGRNDSERRVVVNIIGPTWDGNQVWLIIVGAGMFAIWPRAYAAAFSGFYFAMLLVLWSLFFRPVAFEYRSKLHAPAWRAFWDWALCLGSLIPAILFGAALGNLLLGVPFHYDPMSLRYFYTGNFFGLLRPYALLAGVIGLCMFCMHGAAYVCLRSEGVVQKRAKSAILFFGALFLVGFISASVWLRFIPGYVVTQLPVDPLAHPLSTDVMRTMGGWYHSYDTHWWMWIAPLLACIGIFGTVTFAGVDKFVMSFSASVIAILGILLTFGLGTFPFIMPSNTHPDESLLIWNASSSKESLLGILVVALIMLPIIFFYTNFVYRKLWGCEKTMSVKRIQSGEHLY